ncbi:MAG: phosphopentomutase [Armatimonadetes bacterium]|nr:phosphopentomutase [Armatimonadota bacterium]
MNRINRAIIIVLDSVGVGEMPDAGEYGDFGSSTLPHVAEAVGGLRMPNMQRLGLGNIVSISGVEPADAPEGHYGKMATISKGKDTTVGHWEMMGVITDPAFPTYPHGFPPEVIAEFEKRVGRKALGNKAASGTEIIKELGEEHMRTGSPIVYTSADSVFQIAAHEEIIPIDELYRICEMAREMLVAPHNVERVIARPFIGEPGTFSRTERRRDYSLKPTDTSLLDLVKQSGREVIGIGQIEDIFAGCGISRSIHSGNNLDGIEATISAISSGQGSIIFTNLADFDMLYGHRNDPQGYARALEDFDAALPRIIDALHDDDLLIITADHGCDPTTPSTDHCREYVPILVYGKNILKSIDLGTRTSLCDLAVTLAEVLGVAHSFKGTSF